jgi:hypothetical protein
MFVRIVNGRAYLAETARVGGRVVQQHIGPATPDMIAIVAMLAADRKELRQVERLRRDEEHERDWELAERWAKVRREFETTMQVAGYHNPNGRGWRKRREAKS